MNEWISCYMNCYRNVPSVRYHVIVCYRHRSCVQCNSVMLSDVMLSVWSSILYRSFLCYVIVFVLSSSIIIMSSCVCNVQYCLLSLSVDRVSVLLYELYRYINYIQLVFSHRVINVHQSLYCVSRYPGVICTQLVFNYRSAVRWWTWISDEMFSQLELSMVS